MPIFDIQSLSMARYGIMEIRSRKDLGDFLSLQKESRKNKRKKEFIATQSESKLFIFFSKNHSKFVTRRKNLRNLD